MPQQGGKSPSSVPAVVALPNALPRKWSILGIVCLDQRRTFTSPCSRPHARRKASLQWLLKPRVCPASSYVFVHSLLGRLPTETRLRRINTPLAPVQRPGGLARKGFANDKRGRIERPVAWRNHENLERTDRSSSPGTCGLHQHRRDELAGAEPCLGPGKSPGYDDRRPLPGMAARAGRLRGQSHPQGNSRGVNGKGRGSGNLHSSGRCSARTAIDIPQRPSSVFRQRRPIVPDIVTPCFRRERSGAKAGDHGECRGKPYLHQ